MVQTDHTAIVIHHTDYRDNDRMLTLFSPTKGRLEVMSRGCRRPKSPLLACSELFALGDFDLYQKGERLTLTGSTLIETFYPLRLDIERLCCGMYLLQTCEAVIQPGQENRELFMLLLHTLSRLAFTDQPWRPLLAGYLTHFAAIEGYGLQLDRCCLCGQPLPQDAAIFLHMSEGGICCHACREQAREIERRLSYPPRPGQTCADIILPAAQAELRWLRQTLQGGASTWVDTTEAYAPVTAMRRFVELRLGRRPRSGSMLPEA